MTYKAAFPVAAGVVLLSASGCVNRAQQQQAKRTEAIITNPTRPVIFTPVKIQTLTQTLEITGDVTTSSDAMAGAKNSGRLVDVYVRDGDAVKAGQVIAVQDTSNQRIQLQQALAQEASAQSALTQAIANLRVGPSKSTAAVLMAQAQLNSAKSQLQKALNGARPEERAQADANVAAAKSSMDTAQKTRDRQRQLLDQGAISQQDFDTAENAYENAVSQYQNALESQRLSRAQTRPEDIQAARDAVASAQENLNSARAQKKLDSLLVDQVTAAHANLHVSEAQVRQAEQGIADAQIRAPFDGRVDGKPTPVGTVVSSGGQVAHIVGRAGTYFEGQVSEDDVSQMSTGSPVEVNLDALPGQSFPGHVAAISPSASSIGRLFTIRVQLDSQSPAIKPGMFARGEVIVRKIPNATVVPAIALVRKNGENYVFVVEGQKAHQLKVGTGLREGDLIEVTGLSPGEQVITTGQTDLAEGSPIKPQSADESASAQRGA